MSISDASSFARSVAAAVLLKRSRSSTRRSSSARWASAESPRGSACPTTRNPSALSMSPEALSHSDLPQNNRSVDFARSLDCKFAILISSSWARRCFEWVSFPVPPPRMHALRYCAAFFAARSLEVSYRDLLLASDSLGGGRKNLTLDAVRSPSRCEDSIFSISLRLSPCGIWGCGTISRFMHVPRCLHARMRRIARVQGILRTCLPNLRSASLQARSRGEDPSMIVSRLTESLSLFTLLHACIGGGPARLCLVGVTCSLPLPAGEPPPDRAL